MIARWDGGGITTVSGPIRPGDREHWPGAPIAAGAEGTSGTGDVGEDGSGGTAGPGEDDAPRNLVPSASWEGDLRTGRAAVIGTALAADPALAHDLLLFRVASDLMAGFGSVSYALRVTAHRAPRPHGKPGEVDPRPAEALERLRGELDLAWQEHRTVPVQFEAFRALEPAMKARIVAVAMPDAVEPCDLDYREPLLAHVARLAVPDLRAVWRPTVGAFFARPTKGVPLDLLARDLCQPEEAARLAGEKKGAVVDHLESLYAEPFATLTPEQREAVETRMPPGMAFEPARPLDEPGDDAPEPDDALPCGESEATAPVGDPEAEEDRGRAAGEEEPEDPAADQPAEAPEPAPDTQPA